MGYYNKSLVAGLLVLLPSFATSSGSSVDVPKEVVIRDQIKNPCTHEMVNIKTTITSHLIRQHGDHLKLKIGNKHETGDGYSGLSKKKRIHVAHDDDSESSDSSDSDSYSGSSSDDSDDGVKFNTLIKNHFDGSKVKIKSQVIPEVVENEDGSLSVSYTQKIDKLQCKKKPNPPDLTGKTVNILGPERGFDSEVLQQVFDQFGSTNGLNIRYFGTEDFQAIIDEAISNQNKLQAEIDGELVVFDIAILPQPGTLPTLVDLGIAKKISKTNNAALSANWTQTWEDYVTIGSKAYGVPNKTDAKSIVYYRPNEFASKGYAIPQTWEELVALSNDMVSKGDTAWCVGLESGFATGWNFTDWVEVLLLGSEPVDVYDDWVTNDVGFTDPRIKQIFNDVLGLWNTPGVVFGDPNNIGQSIVLTQFFQAVFDFVGSNCMMHRQANFARFAFGPNDDPNDPNFIDAFVFPPKENNDLGIVGAGTFAISLNKNLQTQVVIGFLSSPEYAESRYSIQGGGFLSAVQGFDLGIVADPIEKTLFEILGNPLVKNFRFDASDLMPSEIGASFIGSDPINTQNNVDFTTGPLAGFDGTGYFASADPGNGILNIFGITSGFWAQGSAVVLGAGNNLIFDPFINPLFLGNNFVPPPGFEPSNCTQFPADPNDPLCPAPVPLIVNVLGQIQGTDVDTATQNIQDKFCEVAPGDACP